jgi:methyl-accepting chemotaxis protein
MKRKEKHIKRISIRKRLTSYISAGIITVSILTIVIVGREIFSVTTSLIHEHIVNVSDNKARQAATELTNAVSEASSLAATLSGWQSIPEPERRTIVSALIEQNVIRNKNVSAWAEWEPGLFDRQDEKYKENSYSDKTGRFMPCWSMTTNGISRDHLDMQDPDWIRSVLDNPHPHMLDPHITMINRTQEYISSAIAPIYNVDGTICGMAGININLEKINTELSSLRLYNSGYGIFISSKGFILGHKDKTMQGQMLDMFADSKTHQYFESSRISKNAISFYEKDGTTSILNVITPVYVDNTANPWFFVTRIPVAELYKTGLFLLLFVTAALFILLGISIIITAFVSGKITKPLNKVAYALKNISEGDGDLTVRLAVEQNDEVGQLCDSFNKTIEKIGSSISLIKEKSSGMQKIGQQLSDRMNSTSETVHTISGNITSVKGQMQEHAAGVSEAIAAVDQIVKNIDNLNELIEVQASGITQSSSAIEQITQSIDSVNKILESNSSSVKELETASETGLQNVNETVAFVQKINEQSETLSETSKLIKNIASQTNILAMNAAIEAAHAGNAGNGFAVVAGEIHRLAEESGSGGKKIEEMLKDVNTVINLVTKSVATIQKQFSVIFNLIKAVGQKETTITTAMHEQNEGGQQILIAIHEIHDSTARVKSASGEMLLGSREVGTEMTKLADMTQSVNTSMSDMTAKTVSIADTVSKVYLVSQSNLSSINMVLDNINKFKIPEAAEQ